MKKSKKFLKILLSVLIAAVIIIAAFSVYVNGYDGVLPGTYIEYTNISKMSKDEVREFLSATYSSDNLSGAVIPLTCNTNSYDLNLDELGITFDNDATIEKAFTSGKDGNIITNTVAYVSRWFTPVTIKPTLVYNKDILATALDTVANGFEIEPVGHTFEFGANSVTIHAPVDGVKVNRETATEMIEAKIIDADFGSLDFVPESVTPEPLDFNEFYEWLTSKEVDAFYEKVDGKVVVRESKARCEVDRSAVENALATLRTDSLTKIEVPAVVTEPENTTAKMTENLYKDVLGSYSTNFGSSSASRANNVRLAASRIDGTELMPGEEFSYDKTILPRTYANGYREAGVYVGNRVESGLGGGICQPSSTLYAAALYANLEILERHNHSLPVSYLPAGLDATIAEGYLDLRIRNNLDYPIKISAVTEGGVITFKILGYNHDNTSVDIERGYSGGAYHVTRVVKKDGEVVKREQMTSSVYGTKDTSETDQKKPETEKKEEDKKTNETQTNTTIDSQSSTPQAEVPEADAPQAEAPSTSTPSTPAPSTPAPSTPAPSTPEPAPEAPATPDPAPTTPEAPAVTQ